MLESISKESFKTRTNKEFEENIQRFLKTFMGLAQKSWIEENESKNPFIVYTLGSGASYIELNSIKRIFPNILGLAVDINPDFAIFAEFFGFEFICDSAADEKIYTDEAGNVITPDLIIIRNPNPRDEKVWVEAVKLAWSKLKENGVIYITTSCEEKEYISRILSNSLNKPISEIDEFWRKNSSPLKGVVFRDDFVFLLKKVN